MSFKMTDKVTWVGKIDWELRRWTSRRSGCRKASTFLFEE